MINNQIKYDELPLSKQFEIAKHKASIETLNLEDARAMAISFMELYVSTKQVFSKMIQQDIEVQLPPVQKPSK